MNSPNQINHQESLPAQQPFRFPWHAVQDSMTHVKGRALRETIREKIEDLNLAVTAAEADQYFSSLIGASDAALGTVARVHRRAIDKLARVLLDQKPLNTEYLHKAAVICGKMNQATGRDRFEMHARASFRMACKAGLNNAYFMSDYTEFLLCVKDFKGAREILSRRYKSLQGLQPQDRDEESSEKREVMTASDSFACAMYYDACGQEVTGSERRTPNGLALSFCRRALGQAWESRDENLVTQIINLQKAIEDENNYEEIGWPAARERHVRLMMDPG